MKKKKDNRNKWVHLRVSQKEYDILQKWVKGTTCRKASELVRDILFHQPVTVFYRNESADDFLDAFLDLKKELNSIGTNINQVVKGIHISRDHEEVAALLFDLAVQHKIMLKKVDEIKANDYEIYRLMIDEFRSKKSYTIESIFAGIEHTAVADQQGDKSGQ